MYWQDGCTQPPCNEMTLEGGFLLCEWKSPWQLTTVGQHVEGKKWQNVTSVFPCSFSFKTKGLLKSASVNGCVCVSVCLFLSFQVIFVDIKSNQIASYHYGNHVCHSKTIKKKKESVSGTQKNLSQRLKSISGNRGCWSGEGKREGGWGERAK